MSEPRPTTGAEVSAAMREAPASMPEASLAWKVRDRQHKESANALVSVVQMYTTIVSEKSARIDVLEKELVRLRFEVAAYKVRDHRAATSKEEDP